MGGAEESTVFEPAFGPDGLIAAIVADSATGEVLMFAWMNAEALKRTVETGEAHFWSRSRRSLWRKGERSGEALKVVEVRTDCDQDALLLKVEPRGRGAACHTGRRSCFYRTVNRVGDGARLEIADDRIHFDPAEVYRKGPTD